jgi:hypothetical protein
MRKQCVKKTELFARRSHLSVTGKGFCLAASLLILIAASLRAGEQVITFAMSQPSGINFIESSADFNSSTDNSLFDLKISQPETTSLNSEKVMATSADGWFEKQTNTDQLESFPLARKDSHSNKSVSVQFGYGRIWDDNSLFQIIAPDHQEPGIAYVSTNLSF